MSKAAAGNAIALHNVGADIGKAHPVNAVPADEAKAAGNSFTYVE